MLPAMQAEAERILEKNGYEKLPDCFEVDRFQKDAEKILSDLLKGEFREIKKQVHLIVSAKFKSANVAMVWQYFYNDFNSLIVLNFYRYFYTDPARYKSELEKNLRHELLHILTDAADDDWQFKDEASLRGIWTSSLSEEIARKERAK